MKPQLIVKTARDLDVLMRQSRHYKSVRLSVPVLPEQDLLDEELRLKRLLNSRGRSTLIVVVMLVVLPVYAVVFPVSLGDGAELWRAVGIFLGACAVGAGIGKITALWARHWRLRYAITRLQRRIGDKAPQARRIGAFAGA